MRFWYSKKGSPISNNFYFRLLKIIYYFHKIVSDSWNSQRSLFIYLTLAVNADFATFSKKYYYTYNFYKDT